MHASQRYCAGSENDMPAEGQVGASTAFHIMLRRLLWSILHQREVISAKAVWSDIYMHGAQSSTSAIS